MKKIKDKISELNSNKIDSDTPYKQNKRYDSSGNICINDYTNSHSQEKLYFKLLFLKIKSFLKQIIKLIDYYLLLIENQIIKFFY